MILLVLFMAATTWASPIVIRTQGHQCKEERVVRTIENITRIVNVTVTVHETREHVETVTRCCPGYISDNNNECVQISEEEEEGSGSDIQNADLANKKTDTSNMMFDLVLVVLTSIIIGTILGATTSLLRFYIERKRKILENKKPRFTVFLSRKKNQDGRKEEPWLSMYT